MIVELWFFEFTTDDSIQGNEQEGGAIEGHALADNRSEIDSDCPEITNCSGKLSPIFIIMCTLFMTKDNTTRLGWYSLSFDFIVSELQDLDRHDPILDKFETIIQDITVYYTKKLDMLRIKSEQHQVSL